MDVSLPVTEAIQKWMQVFMHSSMRKFILFAKENNISISQMGALQFIRHKGTCGVSDIGGELGISNAAASQMLDRMVQQRLIQRSEDINDRRSKQIILLENGHKILEESMRARLRWMGELTQLLTPAEQEQVIDTMNILIDKASLLDTTLKDTLEEDNNSNRT